MCSYIYIDSTFGGLPGTITTSNPPPGPPPYKGCGSLRWCMPLGHCPNPGAFTCDAGHAHAEVYVPGAPRSVFLAACAPGVATADVYKGMYSRHASPPTYTFDLHRFTLHRPPVGHTALATVRLLGYPKDEWGPEVMDPRFLASYEPELPDGDGVYYLLHVEWDGETQNVTIGGRGLQPEDASLNFRETHSGLMLTRGRGKVTVQLKDVPEPDWPKPRLALLHISQKCRPGTLPGTTD